MSKTTKMVLMAIVFGLAIFAIYRTYRLFTAGNTIVQAATGGLFSLTSIPSALFNGALKFISPLLP